MGYLSETVWKDEYKYYDTPEGQDCSKKILYVTKYAGLYALSAATADVLAYSHPKGYGQILGRYATIVFPVMGMGAAFAAATCAATNIRKKDDPLNYTIGAVAATSVCAAWRKSFKIGIYGGIAFGLLAAVYKDMLDRKWHIFTNYESGRMHMPTWYHDIDWTLTEDPGRTWTRK